jgi:trk system potassium uptake protein TrkH
MNSHHPEWLSKPTLYPARAVWLRRLDAFAQIVGVAALILGHGQRRSGILSWECGLIVIGSMFCISMAITLRYRWSLARLSFGYRHLWTVLAAVFWVAGMIVMTIIGPFLPDINAESFGDSRWWSYVNLSEVILILYSISGFIRGVRQAASGGVNPAFLLVMSFVILITAGTLILMLPICHRSPIDEPLVGAPWLTALFTATSASCVTGLVVESTPTYWSPVGHLVILALFQIGGLGIMTFGAFFAAIAGRNVRLTEFATLRDMFASEALEDIRRLIFAIAGFTFLSEAIGALLLMTLWPDLPWPERIFNGVFHSVSGFCNAGFALTPDNFVGMADRWQVSGVLCGLIIVGGLGFAVLYNLFVWSWNFVIRCLRPDVFRFPRQRVRLRLTTKLVIVTTLCLLIGGAVGIYFLDRTQPGTGINICDSWFQSVTFRTAGFNTVDLGKLSPAAKLLGIVLMLIGASPGSTGGGVKTTVFAVAIVGVASVMRGRDRVEAFGRTIPAVTVNRAMAILFVFLLTFLIASGLVMIFEGRPQLFLDHLFEVASAAGTVGVTSSTVLPSGEYVSITQSLSSPSRLVIIMTMFLGRVGPLTLLLALAGEAPAVRYEYPPERVTLG